MKSINGKRMVSVLDMWRSSKTKKYAKKQGPWKSFINHLLSEAKADFIAIGNTRYYDEGVVLSIISKYDATTRQKTDAHHEMKKKKDREYQRAKRSKYITRDELVSMQLIIKDTASQVVALNAKVEKLFKALQGVMP